MRLIKTVKLYYTQGTSDKVYEVDLCEQPNDDANRYWVNFRYGRRGTTLREGTKTVTPVDLAQAEAIFTSVVVAKTNKGYRESSLRRLLITPTSSASLSERLSQIDGINESLQRARSIWRLPQQPDPVLAAWLEKGLSPQNHWLENYARLRTLGRTGEVRNLTKVKTLLASESLPLRHLAYEVWLRLSDEAERSVQQAQLLATLPGELASAITANDSTALDILLAQRINEHNPDASERLKTLYLLALDNAPLHQSLLRLAKDLPLRPTLFKGIRYLFKMAEFRLDAAMFALLVWRFDTTREFYSADWDWAWLEGTGYIKPSAELVRADSRLAYSKKTRHYLRRHSWRSLQRLGVTGDPRYVDMASALLLQYHDTDLLPERPCYRGTYAADAHLFAWNAILRLHNPRYQRHSQRALWIRLSEGRDTQRGEAFPALWDQRPDALLALLLHSDSHAVIEFALRALKDNSEFCRNLTDQQLAKLLARPSAVIAEWVLAHLARRPLSHALLVALIQSPHSQARVMALTQLNALSMLFDDTELSVALLLTDDEEIGRWLDARLIQQPLNGVQKDALMQALLAQLSLATTGFSPQHAQWLSICCTTHLSAAVHSVSLEILSTLLGHADVGVQILAAQLLVSSRFTLNDLPQALVSQLHHSPVAAVRASGIALLGKQSPETLLRQLSLLVDLLSCGEEAERQACFGLLQQLARSDASAVFAALFPLLFQKEAQEGAHQALLTFIRQHLSPCLETLDKDTLWRLIQARASAAQTLGGEVLQSRSPLEFSVRQWVVLANHPERAIRDYALRAFEQHVDVVREQSREALAVLESDWPTTREFAFAYFRQHYPAQSWTPELIVNLCDSNREDVQAWGRELLQTFFHRDRGEEYLLKLSQHPSVTVQTFVTHFFADYAAGKPQVILALRPCFLAILSQVNRGRVAKDRTLAFLAQQAECSPQVLEMVSELLTRLSLTVVQKDKAPLIKTMLQLQKRHPELTLPLEIVVRSAQGARHAG